MATVISALARIMAIIGGIVLTALVTLTCVSVIGRGLNTFGHSGFLAATSEQFGNWLVASGVGPITGDYELVEAGIAFAIFAFLPICQLYRGHATVDIFTSVLPARINAALALFWEIVLSFLIILIAWRLYVGMGDKLRYGETTFLLQFPIWWAYALSLFAACIAVIVSLWCIVLRWQDMLTGHAPAHEGEGASH